MLFLKRFKYFFKGFLPLYHSIYIVQVLGKVQFVVNKEMRVHQESFLLFQYPVCADALVARLPKVGVQDCLPTDGACAGALFLRPILIHTYLYIMLRLQWSVQIPTRNTKTSTRQNNNIFIQNQKCFHLNIQRQKNHLYGMFLKLFAGYLQMCHHC